MIWALIVASLIACKEDEEVTYTQFNATDDTLTIQVGLAETTDPVTVALHSSTGAVEVGTATVDPGGGPIQTEHTILVEVYDDWEDQVVRASLRTDSGSRGEDEYEMEGDSADEGLYQLILVSQGEAGEQREDTFTIRLWEQVGVEIEGEDTEEGETAEGGDTSDSGDTSR